MQECRTVGMRIMMRFYDENFIDNYDLNQDYYYYQIYDDKYVGLQECRNAGMQECSNVRMLE